MKPLPAPDIHAENLRQNRTRCQFVRVGLPRLCCASVQQGLHVCCRCLPAGIACLLCVWFCVLFISTHCVRDRVCVVRVCSRACMCVVDVFPQGSRVCCACGFVCCLLALIV